MRSIVVVKSPKATKILDAAKVVAKASKEISLDELNTIDQSDIDLILLPVEEIHNRKLPNSLVIAYGEPTEVEDQYPTIAKMGIYDLITTTETKAWYVDYLNRLSARTSSFTIYQSNLQTPPLTSKDAPSNWIIESDKMRAVFASVHRLAHFTTTVLICGESGTGKELIARELHTRSPRANKPFIAINCGAIPEALMESELFGHKKGSFTDATSDKRGLFEEADGGTLFLDEIGELPLHLQVKLLRALQERRIRRVGGEELIPIDVRVVAATLRNLEEDVIEGRFREDLFYRLNVVTISLPPLRDRTSEIPNLISHFINKHGKRLGVKVRSFSDEALACLMQYDWPGNIRELENCVERAMVLSPTPIVEPSLLPPGIRGEDQTTDSKSKLPGELILDNLSIKEKTRELERILIQRALEQTGGNRTRAAKVLEISHRALLYKLKEYQFE